PIHHFWVKARLSKKLRQLPPLPLPLPPPPPPPAQYEPVLVPASAMTSGAIPVGNIVRYHLESLGERERTTPLPYEPELSVDEPNTGAATAFPMKLIKEDGMEFGFGRNARCLSPSSMYLGTSAGGSRDRHGVARGISTIERYRRQARWLPNPITLLIEIVVNISCSDEPFINLIGLDTMLALSPILTNFQIKVMESELVMTMGLSQIRHSSSSSFPSLSPHASLLSIPLYDPELPLLQVFLTKATGGPEQDDDPDET
ncbi:hypothetical protein FRB91_006932, partial [Serendipita sp. 411]